MIHYKCFKHLFYCELLCLLWLTILRFIVCLVMVKYINPHEKWYNHLYDLIDTSTKSMYTISQKSISPDQ